MGTVSVTIGGVDATAFIYLENAKVEDHANHQKGVFSFRLRDENPVTGAALFAIRERMEVIATDSAAGRIFGGQIASLDPSLDGLSVEYDVACQSFDCLLDMRVITSTATAPALPVWDDDLVDWIVAFGSDLGLTSPAATVERLAETQIDTKYPKVKGRTLRDALTQVHQHTEGAIRWVDHDKRVHWIGVDSNNAVRNGDFERTIQYWGTLPTGGSFDANGGAAGTGDACLKVIGTGAGRHVTDQTNSTIIVAGRAYLVQADLFSGLVGHAQVAIEWQTSAGTVISTTADIPNTVASAWERVSLYVTAPATAAKARIMCRTPSASTATSKWNNVSMLGVTAAWGVSTSPDGSTTFAPQEWKRPTDAPRPVNKVYIRGKGSFAGWRSNNASIAYFGKTFEGVLDDDRVTLQTGLDSRARWFFGKNAFPTHSGTYKTQRSGLVAGDWQRIVIEPLGLDSVEFIATIETTFDGDGVCSFHVTYGAPTGDAASLLASMQQSFTQIEPGATPEVRDGSIQTSGIHDEGLDADVALTPASLNLAPFAATIRPVAIVSTLPTLPSSSYPVNATVVLTTDNKLYKNVAEAWVPVVRAVDLDGQLLTAQIADAAINTAKFATGIRPVAIVATLPTLPSATYPAGSYAYLTTDGRLYVTKDGTTWTAAVNTTDISGTLSTAQIADLAVTGAKIAAAAVTAAKITAGTITGNEIAAGAIAAGNIAADTITAGQIAAGAIGASEIAAGAVNASKIAAGSITANEIAAGTITGSNIAAGTIAAANIAAGTITSSQIAADTITAGQIAAGGIGASEIAVGALDNKDQSHASGQVLISSAGIAITGGKLTVSNSGGTTTIDGSSKVLGIIYEGTHSLACAAQRVEYESVTVTGITGLTKTPAFLSWLSPGTNAAEPRDTGTFIVPKRAVNSADDSRIFGAAVSGGSVNDGMVWLIETWQTAVTLTAVPGSPQLAIRAAVVSARTMYASFMLCREASF